MKDYVDVIVDSWNGYRNQKITIRIDAIQYYAYNTDIVSGKLYLEVFLEQNENYTISDTTLCTSIFKCRCYYAKRF